MAEVKRRAWLHHSHPGVTCVSQSLCLSLIVLFRPLCAYLQGNNIRQWMNYYYIHS